MTKRKRLSLVSFIAIVLVIGTALVLIQTGIFGIKFSWVSPGWEIYDQMGAMRFHDQVLTRSDQFNTPREVFSTYWKVDVDNETYDIPTIMVEMSDVKHVDFSGKEIPYDTYVETREVTRGNTTFYLDYHIYTYTVTIRTIADKTVIPETIWEIARVYHETTWPYIGQRGPPFPSHIDGPETGEHYVGGAYTKFIINPWKGVTYRSGPNSSYNLENCWAGVMNTYIMYKQEGTIKNQWGSIPTPAPDAQYWVKGGLDMGAQVPMLEDDGSFGTPAPRVDWDPSVTPDIRIASAVVHYLPVDLAAGGDPHYNSLGNCDDIYPVDVAVMYTLRIDVLQTHEFSLQTGKPPDITWPEDYFGWSEDFWVGLLNGLNPFAFLGPLAPLAWFIVTLIAIGFIILIVLSIFAPWVLPKIFGGLRQARDFAFEGTGRKKKG